MGQYDKSTLQNYETDRNAQSKLGEFFRLANSESAPVWVRDEYNRSSRKFEAYKYDDVNNWSEFNGSRLVYVDFVY